MPRLILLLTILLTAGAGLAGELTDHGPEGVCFFDDATSYYWLDPVTFLDLERASVDRFATQSTTWRWATSAEIDGLLGATIPDGVEFESVLGLRQSSVGSGGPRWLGFYAGEAPDGWLIQSLAVPNEVIDYTGSQAGAAELLHGAWLLAEADPVTAPRLDHLGSAASAYFYDQATDLYWCDPGTFAGLARNGMNAWLSDNPDWRWATLDEVYGLLGKFTVGDVALVDVLGEPQQTVAGGIPRWLGYCGNTAEDDAVLLQAGSTGTVLPMLVAGDLQSMADETITAAWIVSEVNPTPVQATSLGAVKAMFR